MPKIKFDALKGFRALAAILVFIYHNRKYWRDFIHPEVLRLINEFHIGVSVFFVLSGFLIAFTYEDKPIKNLKYEQEFKIWLLFLRKICHSKT